MPFIRSGVTFLLVLTTGPVAACGGGGEERRAPGPSRSAQTQVGDRLRGLLPEALVQGARVPADPRAGSDVPLAPALRFAPESGRRQAAQFTVRPVQERRAAAERPERTQAIAPDADYDEFVKAVIPLIDQYWERKTAQVNPQASYEPPGRLVSYNGSDGPGCVGDKSEDMSRNAYYCVSLVPENQCKVVSKNEAYCSGQDLIAWDKPGLMLPFYREIGTLAAALVLAHEWGHLAQARVFPQFVYRSTIRNELQADCYAGAWALEMKRQGRVDVGAFNQALALFSAVGGDGDAWLDPKSHGNKFQRVRAFTQGFEQDTDGCIGRPFDGLLQKIGLGEETPGLDVRPRTTGAAETTPGG